ncbi:MAG TPA: PAS domain S-box protein [Burkholderiales bacterium]|nr:PAS domain S-box protein [Burkholderiales bacterium]
MDFDARALIESAGDAIIVADTRGRIIFWNGAAERLFGHARDEALGQSLDLIIPERQRARHWAGYEKTMASGETKYGTQLLRVPAMHKDGRRISIAFTVTLLFDANRKVQAIAAIVRDDTERRRLEQAQAVKR